MTFASMSRVIGYRLPSLCRPASVGLADLSPPIDGVGAFDRLQQHDRGLVGVKTIGGVRGQHGHVAAPGDDAPHPGACGFMTKLDRTASAFGGFLVN